MIRGFTRRRFTSCVRVDHGYRTYPPAVPVYRDPEERITDFCIELLRRVKSALVVTRRHSPRCIYRPTRVSRRESGTAVRGKEGRRRGEKKVSESEEETTVVSEGEKREKREGPRT